MILILGALLGFLSVALGAYAEHGLREVVTDEYFRSLMPLFKYGETSNIPFQPSSIST